MLIDDRLGTVLRQRSGGDAVTRIQYRQLLDLLGTLPGEAAGPQIDAAFERIASISAMIPAAARAAMLRDPGLRLRSPRLVALLAGGEPAVADAAIERADLDPEQWLDLAPALPLHARGAMRSRRDLGPVVERQMERLGIRERGLPAAQAGPAAADPAPPAQPDDAPPAPHPAAAAAPLAAEGIGAIVRRIERFRQARRITDGEAPSSDAPGLPLELPSGQQSQQAPLECFDFAADGEGRIDWADPGVAPMVCGMCLTTGDGIGPFSASAGVAAAFSRRQPIRGGTIEIIGAPRVAGTWRVDAAPLFDPVGGRFTGYAGRLRRTTPPPAPPPPGIRGGDDADRMRQLLHELRTPVNAIQGFAEVIQQQLFGPSPHEYRALAAAIAGDAARLLAGFDELDRLAKLDTGALELEAGETDLVAVFAATAERLAPYAAARSGGFSLRVEDGALPVALGLAEVERLAWRLLATLAGASAPGETLKLRLRRRDGEARVSLELPASLAASEAEDIFKAALPQAPQALSAGMFGAGFALRLARSEARAAGGMLERRKGRLRLNLPLLAAASSDAGGLDLAGGGQ